MKLLIALPFLFTTAAPAAQPEEAVYRYLVESHPQRNVPCAQHAAEVRDGFRKQTGIALVSARCLNEKGGRYDIELRYTATERVVPVSTVETVIGIPQQEQGSFHTAAACEASLKSQTELFAKETGLEPLVAYCFRESSEARHSFVLRVEAFGKPLHKAIARTDMLFGSPVTNVEVEEARLRAYAEKKLPSLSSISLRTHSLEHGIRFVYYSEYGLAIGTERLAEYKNVGDCSRAVVLLEGKLATIPTPPIPLCVSRRFSGGFAIELFQVRHGTYVKQTPHPQTYATFADCEAGEAAVLKEVAASGAEALAAVCQGRNGLISPTVLTVVRNP